GGFAALVRSAMQSINFYIMSNDLRSDCVALRIRCYLPSKPCEVPQNLSEPPPLSFEPGQQSRHNGPAADPEEKPVHRFARRDVPELRRPTRASGRNEKASIRSAACEGVNAKDLLAGLDVYHDRHKP